MAVCLRPAELRDAAFLAEVILIASRSHLGRGGWDLGLPEPDGERLRILSGLARAATRTFCHHSLYLIAEDDGVPAAALCGFGAETLDSLDPNPTIQAVAGWTSVELDAANRRLAPFMTCIAEPPSGAWIVEFVATLPPFRRRGLGTALLEKILARGRDAGHRLAQIEVLIGNTPAQRAYEKVGFRVVGERTHPEFEAALHCPGIRRLWRDL